MCGVAVSSATFSKASRPVETKLKASGVGSGPQPFDRQRNRRGATRTVFSAATDRRKRRDRIRRVTGGGCYRLSLSRT